METLTAEEKVVYDRIITILNYNYGSKHNSISINALAGEYPTIAKTTLAEDCRKLGVPNIPMLLRKFNICVTPTGMIATTTPGSDENGAAGVIDLMRKTTDNPKPKYTDYGKPTKLRPRVSQSSFTGNLNYPTTSKPGLHVPLKFLRKIVATPDLSKPASTNWSEYYALPSAHRSSSEIMVSSTQLPQPSNIPMPHRSSRRRNCTLDQHGPSSHRSTSPMKSVPNNNKNQNGSNLKTSAISAMLSSRPEPSILSPQSLNTDTSSSPEKKISEKKIYGLSPKPPQFVVKSVIFDTNSRLWKIALQRPRTVADAKFFRFCGSAEKIIDSFPVIDRKDLIVGKCYFVKHNGKYYRGIYIAPSRDNVHGLFDFADFEVVNPILFSNIRCVPRIAEVAVPYMITWAFSNDGCNVSEKDRVECTFSHTFEEVCYRKIHRVHLRKIQK